MSAAPIPWEVRSYPGRGGVMGRHQVYQWERALAEAFGGLGQDVLARLAAFSLGIALAGSCTLRRAAEALGGLGKPDTLERRFQRYGADPKVDHAAGCRALSRWVLGRLVTGGRVVLLVDETALRDRLRVMVVSVAYRKRAIPVAWWVYRPEGWPMRQVPLILTLLGWVKPAVPPGVEVVVEADRGIGTSPELLAGIEALGFAYLVRVAGHGRLRLRDGREVMIRDLVRRPGERWQGEVAAFKKAGWRRCRAIACWEAGRKEPWLLLTNWRGARAQGYALRMWQEAGFRDLKSFGFGWQRSRVWRPAHANRLWLAMAVAYAWVVSLGTRAQQEPAWRREVRRGRQPRASVVTLGRSLLLRRLGPDPVGPLRLHFDPTLDMGLS